MIRPSTWTFLGGAITVTQRPNDFHACITGKSHLWACGNSTASAIGDLVMHHGDAVITAAQAGNADDAPSGDRGFTQRFQEFAIGMLLSISESALRTNDPYESADALLSISVALKKGVRVAVRQGNRMHWLKAAQCYWYMAQN